MNINKYVLYRGLFFIGALFYLTACSKSIKQIEDNPILEIFPIKEVNERGVTLSGRILAIGDVEVIDKGFTWTPTELIPSFELGLRAYHSLGKDIKMGEELNLRLERDLWPNRDFSFRIYVKTKQGTFYSKPELVVSKGSAETLFEEHPIPYANLGFDTFLQNLGFRGSLQLNQGPKTYIRAKNGDVLLYNSDTKQWTIQGKFSFYPLGADTKMFYGITGVSGNYKMHTYDPITNQTQIFGVTTPIEFDRLRSVVFSFYFNDLVYFVAENLTYDFEVWELNPTERKIRLLGDPKLNAFVDSVIPTFVQDGDRVYMIWATKNGNQFWEYRIKEDRWNILANFPSAQQDYFWTATYNGRIYAGNNFYNSVPTFGTKSTPSYWSYDPRSGLWQHEGWKPTPGEVMYSFTVKNKSYWICKDATLLTGAFPNAATAYMYSFGK